MGQCLIGLRTGHDRAEVLAGVWRLVIGLRKALHWVRLGCISDTDKRVVTRSHCFDPKACPLESRHGPGVERSSLGAPGVGIDAVDSKIMGRRLDPDLREVGATRIVGADEDQLRNFAIVSSFVNQGCELVKGVLAFRRDQVGLGMDLGKKGCKFWGNPISHTAMYSLGTFTMSRTLGNERCWSSPRQRRRKEWGSSAKCVVVTPRATRASASHIGELGA